MQPYLQHFTGIVSRFWVSSLVVLTASSVAHAQQPVTYTTPTYTYQTAQPTYTPQYYQTSYTQQYYQPTYATTPAPATYATQPQQMVYAQAPQAASGGDAYGFLNWLNATRASYGLSAVSYDANLESWASVNNAQQNARGMGHHVMGPARRQNSAMGSFANVPAMWMASPGHRAALLDPTIRFIGIAGMGAYWTFNAN